MGGPGRGGRGRAAGKGRGNPASTRGGKDAAGDRPAGRGSAKAAPAAVEPDAEPADTDDGEGKVTRALVEALRAFSAPRWWLIGSKDGDKEAPAPTARKRMKIEEWQQKCEERHAQMRKVYESTMLQDSEQRWLRKVSSGGTSGDKIASLTMLIQVCPVFATGWIRSLLSMAGKTTRSDSAMALDALKGLFVDNLLPDRKLRTFSQMDPISPKGLTKIAFTELAVLAFFEDFVKTAFAGFIHVLSEAAHSNVTYFKNKAIRTAQELLAAKPEQERALLGLLVNKFGDNSPKVSSNVSFHLKKLVEVHPGMKAIIAKEVEIFLARSNVTAKSQYCALLHLSEMVLMRGRDGELAAQLVRIFVSRLEAALKGQRAAGRGGKAAGKGARTSWWKTKGKRKKPGLQDEDNRLVRTLINGIQRAMPYIDTTADSSPLQEETLNALYKACHTVSSFSTRIAILSLLFRHLYERTRGEPPNRFYQLLYEQLGQFDLFGSTHRQQAFLLLQRVIPADISSARALALSRRLLQVGGNSQPPVAVAALAVLRQLLSARRAELRPLLQSVDSQLTADAEPDDADEEHFVDDDTAQAKKAAAEAPALASEERPHYEPSKRDPRFAKARCTPLWELYALRSHVHPFVAHGAARLLEADTFEDIGDNPFETFGHGEMLEEFVLSSRAQRGGKKKGRNKEKGSKVRVSFATDRFLKKKSVAPHERFIQLYYRDSTVQERQREKKSKQKLAESDVDEEGGGGSGDSGEELDEEAEDKFFDAHLQGMLPKDSDDEGGDEDPDMDDDSAFSGEGSEEEGSLAASEPAEDGGSDAGGSSDEASETPRRNKQGAKRKGAAEELPKDRAKRIKALRSAHSGSMFASAEDFEALLAEDEAWREPSAKHGGRRARSEN